MSMSNPALLYQPPLMWKKPYHLALVRSAGFRAHWHSELETLYCRSGHFTIMIDGREYHVRSGEAAVVNTMETHELVPPDKSEECEILVVMLGRALLGDGFYEFYKRDLTRHVMPVSGSVLGEVLEGLADRAGRGRDDADPSAGWSVRALLFRLAALIFEETPCVPVSGHPRQRRALELQRIENVFTYISENYAKPITLDEISAAARYEKKFFCRIFRRVTGMTFHGYLNAYRVETASVLLDSQDISVADAGAAVGIPNLKTFVRVFRQYAGMTPAAYRNRKTPKKQNIGE